MNSGAKLQNYLASCEMREQWFDSFPESHADGGNAAV